jgi:hypothetical protein
MIIKIIKYQISIIIIITTFSCKLDIKHQYPDQKTSYQKQSIGKFFHKELTLFDEKNQKLDKLSRDEFWQKIKEKLKSENFEIDFTDNELFFITTKWKNHDKNNQVKLNILLKNKHKNYSENLSITVTNRFKNSDQKWVISKNEKLEKLYLRKIRTIND